VIDADAERYVVEPPKDPGLPPLPERSPYQRDRARVLHSAAFRRLASKTQVHTTGATGVDDFLRTRLTHSLEVAQIAREMGERLGCDPDVVDTAGLAHDLGHPPFGHNGEDALDEMAAACGGFEGNAQTLRVLTRLEAKVVGADGASAGLNLTRACLDAVSKYPWPRRGGERKFGVYAEDGPVFDWLRRGAGSAGGGAGWAGGGAGWAGGGAGWAGGGAPPARRCLEAQVMDWADDVAYSVHDVEDGIHGGYVQLASLRKDPDERAALCADVAAVYSGESAADLEAVLTDLLDDPLFARVDGYDGSHAGQAALKGFTSVLTGRFVAAAVVATRSAFGGGALRRYRADLVVPRAVRAQCALLKGIALRYVMRRAGAEASYLRQQEILRELVAVLAARAPHEMDPVFAPQWRAAAGDAARLRVVVDQVASLTDPAAVAWHGRLTGRRATTIG
jgi:dGTPase